MATPGNTIQTWWIPELAQHGHYSTCRSVSCLCLSNHESKYVLALRPVAGARDAAGPGGTQQSQMSCPG